MKKFYYMAWLSVALLTGCNNEWTGEQESQDEPEGLVEVTAFGSVGDNVQTRMTFVEEDDGHGGKQLTFKWENEGETIAVLDGNGKIFYFTQVSMENASATTSFGGILESPTEGTTYYALYPEYLAGYGHYSESEPNKVLLSFEAQKGGEEYKALLWSEADYTAAGTLNFKFNYLTCILKILPTFADGDWPYITPYTEDGMQTSFNLSVASGFYSTAELDLQKGTISNAVAASSLPVCSVDIEYAASESHHFKFAEKFTYFAMLPGTIEDMNIKFLLLDGEYEGKVINSHELVAGRFYYAYPVMHKVGFIARKTESVDGDRSKGPISFSEVLKRITDNDLNRSDASRKSFTFLGTTIFNSGGTKTIANLRDDEMGESNEYIGSYSQKSSILGNWLRTEATSVEKVDLSSTDLTKLSDYAFYGCSKAENIGNSALTKLILPYTITEIGNNAFADSGIKHLVLNNINASSLTTVTTPFGAEADMSNINLYLPRLDDAEEAKTIRDLFKVGESLPTVYYGFHGGDYFNIANYTKL